MPKKHKKKNNKGFTLIELLVVISILGLLSSILIVTFNDARLRAQDAKRITDVKQIVQGLELYYDRFGRYPPHAEAWAYFKPECPANPEWCQLQTALSPFIKNLPVDPRFPGDPYIYIYDSNPTDKYQTYGFEVFLAHRSNRRLMENDGGARNDRYEVGQQPRYCGQKYGQGWWAWYSGNPAITTVCGSNGN